MPTLPSAPLFIPAVLRTSGERENTEVTAACSGILTSYHALYVPAIQAHYASAPWTIRSIPLNVMGHLLVNP